MNRKELEQTIIEFLKRHNGGTLATVREDGTSQARASASSHMLRPEVQFFQGMRSKKTFTQGRFPLILRFNQGLPCANGV